MTLRLFAGIPVAGPARAALESALGRWRHQFPAVRWVDAADLHITLQFIGAWEEADEPELIAALTNVIPPRIELAVSGLDAFPSLRRPRIVIAGVAAAPELTALAAGVNRALAPLGIVPEPRPYRPHITLARLRAPAPLPSLVGAGPSAASPSPHPFSSSPAVRAPQGLEPHEPQPGLRGVEVVPTWGDCPVDSFNLYQTLAGHYRIRRRFPR
ncbi:MAG: RNA 2',3'-cyclic phosphodiesterase [Terriglobales bacterium]